MDRNAARSTDPLWISELFEGSSGILFRFFASLGRFSRDFKGFWGIFGVLCRFLNIWKYFFSGSSWKFQRFFGLFWDPSGSITDFRRIGGILWDPGIVFKRRSSLGSSRMAMDPSSGFVGTFFGLFLILRDVMRRFLDIFWNSNRRFCHRSKLIETETFHLNVNLFLFRARNKRNGR